MYIISVYICFSYRVSFIKHISEVTAVNISIMFIRALDKREYLVISRDNFCLFCIKLYIVTPHLNRLDETVQMRGHNIWFR